MSLGGFCIRVVKDVRKAGSLPSVSASRDLVWKVEYFTPVFRGFVCLFGMCVVSGRWSDPASASLSTYVYDPLMVVHARSRMALSLVQSLRSFRMGCRVHRNSSRSVLSCGAILELVSVYSYSVEVSTDQRSVVVYPE